MHFDIATIVLVTSMVFTTQTLVVFLQYRINKTYHGLGWWLAGAISLAAGFFLMQLVRSGSFRFLSAFGNPCVFTGLTLLGIGLNKFFGLKTNLRVSFTILVFSIIAYSMFLFRADGESVRSLLVALITSAISLKIAGTIFVKMKRHFALSAVFTAAVFLIYGLFQAFIVVVRLLSTENLSYQGSSPSPIIVIMFIVPMICSILWTSGFIIMVNQRLIAENHELFKELEREKKLAEYNAITDNLTSLANRRLFDDTLQVEFNRLKRCGKPLSLILLDIDFFKKYNDTYGHQAGDNCLRQIGSVLRTCVKRLSDTAARYGGEEFVIILPETDENGATALAEQICVSVKDLSLTHESSEVADRVTISAGVVTAIPSELNDPEHLLAAADAALYKAKNSGRDCIAVYRDNEAT